MFCVVVGVFWGGGEGGGGASRGLRQEGGTYQKHRATQPLKLKGESGRDGVWKQVEHPVACGRDRNTSLPEIQACQEAGE